jgi:hypothetical protein
MTLAGPWRANKVQDLGAIDELELGERHNAVLVERGLAADRRLGRSRASDGRPGRRCGG